MLQLYVVEWKQYSKWDVKLLGSRPFNMVIDCDIFKLQLTKRLQKDMDQAYLILRTVTCELYHSYKTQCHFLDRLPITMKAKHHRRCVMHSK
jgi:hypothetical protein